MKPVSYTHLEATAVCTAAGFGARKKQATPSITDSTTAVIAKTIRACFSIK